MRDGKLTHRLWRFVVGLVLLAAFYSVFASGYTPPGIAGEVLRHNREYEIDASPLWYMEVENMQELEEGVRHMRLSARSRLSSEPVDSSCNEDRVKDLPASKQPVDDPDSENGGETK